MTRVLDFDGIHNFRDYGGYGAAGGRLRTGMLWRSAQHRDATPLDLQGVADLGLVTVIDLRGDSERAAHPCPRHPEFGAEVLYAEGETAGHAAPHVEAGASAAATATAADIEARMTELYRTMPFRPNLIIAFRHYFTALARRPGPSLVHCLAGKDRTGVAVALLHRALGVHDDDVRADYLLTNSAGRIEARIAAGAAAMRDGFGTQLGEDAMRALMSVHPAYLDAAFASIDAVPGGFEGYLRGTLGVTPGMLADIEAHLVD